MQLHWMKTAQAHNAELTGYAEIPTKHTQARRPLVDCRHIIGFDEGFGSSEGMEYQAPSMIYASEGFIPDIPFNYCPLCGVLL